MNTAKIKKVFETSYKVSKGNRLIVYSSLLKEVIIKINEIPLREFVPMEVDQVYRAGETIAFRR